MLDAATTALLLDYLADTEDAGGLPKVDGGDDEFLRSEDAYGDLFSNLERLEVRIELIVLDRLKNTSAVGRQKVYGHINLTASEKAVCGMCKATPLKQIMNRIALSFH